MSNERSPLINPLVPIEQSQAQIFPSSPASRLAFVELIIYNNRAFVVHAAWSWHSPLDPSPGQNMERLEGLHSISTQPDATAQSSRPAQHSDSNSHLPGPIPFPLPLIGPDGQCPRSCGSISVSSTPSHRTPGVALLASPHNTSVMSTSLCVLP
ncbi:hypothetical protein BD311DRAFT_528291 [Dichomitus squalens]|uniref:Uncharacterized protein n=1 Tax=Dichomitus squalens TaxID=114155 RepID=A0A4Q9MGQ4_9APHY|nr:hypothetical protein BD311DRAFT_528291 [Dichomitus squalens]